jgi:hypothetical protein
MIAFFLLVVIVLVAFAYDVLAWGFVASKYWVWFALPIFPELPELSFGYAVGLMCLASLFRAKIYTSIKNEYKDVQSEITAMVIMPWTFLLFGWITYSIFMV